MLSYRSAQGVALTGAVILLFALSLPQAGAKSPETNKQVPQASSTKLKHKKAHRVASNSNMYLVPPPPAYQPAWLPEAMYSRNSEQATQAEAKPENPYSKYIYTAPGHQGVSSVKQPNKYVTYWSASH